MEASKGHLSDALAVLMPVSTSKVEDFRDVTAPSPVADPWEKPDFLPSRADDTSDGSSSFLEDSALKYLSHWSCDRDVLRRMKVSRRASESSPSALTSHLLIQKS